MKRPKRLSVILRNYKPGPAGIFFRAVLIATLLSAAPVWGEDDLPTLLDQPLSAGFKATAVSEKLSGRAGEQITLSFTLDPPEKPAGSFFSVNVNEQKIPNLVKKDQPKILTGFPDTSMSFSKPGVYQYSVVVSLISKGSCAGVQADRIYKGGVTVEVTP